eukprot:m.181696 g.181696  ORF g.181696 m.181696 type:complete len:503 (-) comp24608_c1_seq1:3720-5228(-)
MYDHASIYELNQRSPCGVGNVRAMQRTVFNPRGRGARGPQCCGNRSVLSRWTQRSAVLALGLCVGLSNCQVTVTTTATGTATAATGPPTGPVRTCPAYTTCRGVGAPALVCPTVNSVPASAIIVGNTSIPDRCVPTQSPYWNLLVDNNRVQDQQSCRVGPPGLVTLMGCRASCVALLGSRCAQWSYSLAGRNGAGYLAGHCLYINTRATRCGPIVFGQESAPGWGVFSKRTPPPTTHSPTQPTATTRTVPLTTSTTPTTFTSTTETETITTTRSATVASTTTTGTATTSAITTAHPTPSPSSSPMSPTQTPSQSAVPTPSITTPMPSTVVTSTPTQPIRPPTNNPLSAPPTSAPLATPTPTVTTPPSSTVTASTGVPSTAPTDLGISTTAAPVASATPSRSPTAPPTAAVPTTAPTPTPRTAAGKTRTADTGVTVAMIAGIVCTVAIVAAGVGCWCCGCCILGGARRRDGTQTKTDTYERMGTNPAFCEDLDAAEGVPDSTA